MEKMEVVVVSVVLSGERLEYARKLKAALEEALLKDGLAPNVRINRLRVPVDE